MSTLTETFWVATVNRFWEKPDTDFSWKNPEGKDLEELFKDDGLNGIENEASADAGGIFSSEEWAAATESLSFGGAESAELSFGDYFASGLASNSDSLALNRFGSGMSKYGKYLDRINQATDGEFLDVLEEDGAEEAVDYLEENVGAPWEKFGMSMEEFEESLNKIYNAAFEAYSEAFDGVYEDGIEALGEGADGGVELLDEWPAISDSAIGDILSDSAMSGIDKINFVDLDLLDEDLGLGGEDLAASAIDGATDLLSGLGDGLMDMSVANLEMLGFDTATMSAEEIVAAALVADLAVVV